MIESIDRKKINHRKGNILLLVAVLATVILSILKLTVLDITWFIVIIPMICYMVFLIGILIFLFVTITRLDREQLQDLEEAIKEKYEND